MPKLNLIRTITKLQLEYLRNIHKSKHILNNCIHDSNTLKNNIDNLINDISINENKLHIIYKHYNIYDLNKKMKEGNNNQDNNYTQPML